MSGPGRLARHDPLPMKYIHHTPAARPPPDVHGRPCRTPRLGLVEPPAEMTRSGPLPPPVLPPPPRLHALNRACGGLSFTPDADRIVPFAPRTPSGSESLASPHPSSSPAWRLQPPARSRHRAPTPAKRARHITRTAVSNPFPPDFRWRPQGLPTRRPHDSPLSAPIPTAPRDRALRPFPRQSLRCRVPRAPRKRASLPIRAAMRRSRANRCRNRFAFGPTWRKDRVSAGNGARRDRTPERPGD